MEITKILHNLLCEILFIVGNIEDHVFTDYPHLGDVQHSLLRSEIKQRFMLHFNQKLLIVSRNQTFFLRYTAIRWMGSLRSIFPMTLMQKIPFTLLLRSNKF